MRKPVLIVLIIVIVALLGAGAVLYQKLRQTQTEYATLQADEQTTRERYNSALTEIAAIQDSLDAVMVGEEGAKALETELEAEKSLSRARSDEAMARISVIKAGVERARARIRDLEAKLDASNLKVAGLEKVVGNLRQSLAEREQMVAQLTQRVEELQTQVTGLTAEVAQKQQTIETQEATIQNQTARIEDSRRSLGTVYYTIGTKKELKEAGLVVSTGGLLGIGRTLKPSGQIDPTRFTPLDTDRENVIRIPDDEAKVISTQPAMSYELVPVEGQVELRILDPQAFRTVKHVIIVVG